MRKILLFAALLIPFAFAGFQNTYVKASHLLEAENNRISEKEAKEIALKKVNGEVVKVTLEKDDGREYYEVIVKSSDIHYEVEIDANTGQVVEVEKEGSRNGNHEDDHDDDDGHEDDDDDHLDD
ncbi:PepSY domain-containing protein [Neobacillus mesonae]|uniref:PepSY domain-containing protein n=1 Tax=Neobacillus mesonae TaxID=1193713 RepID=UPI00203FBB04|nr:PepSY domain-containing protein [Neobacillus mesonae]MCM3568037.1 PepSY domain-containing protein [Neobacillus mesonae]